MQLYIGSRHIFSSDSFGWSLFNLNMSHNDYGTRSFWINGKDWCVDYTPHPLTTGEHIRIGCAIAVATRLIPWVNLYHIRITGFMES